jgi:LPXTG-site transpeptidase (sortase) family protein
MKRGGVLPVVEKALWTVGCLLLLIYVVGRADSAVGTQVALAEAAAMSELADHVSDQPRYRFWSQGRIDAYRASAVLEAGPVIGTLRIPALDLLVPLYATTAEVHLNRGVGLIEGMALPGQPGNLGIAGHRDGFFRVLRDIRKGERVEVRTPEHRYAYEVSGVSIVDKEDSTPLAPTRESSLTLVTCYPFYFVGPAPRRFVVRGVLTSP